MPKKSSKRANGHGSKPLQRGDSYTMQVTLGRRRDGKLDRRRVTASTREEVEQKARELQVLYTKGMIAEPDSVTFKERGELWLRRKARTARPKTLEGYGWLLRRYVYPHLGERKVQALRPPHIRGFYESLLESGMSSETFRQVRYLVRAILEDALADEIVARNVAHGVRVELPKTQRTGQSWSPLEVRAFLQAATNERLYPLFYLMLTLGLRRGEVLGLRWVDVNLEGSTLRVSQTLTLVGGKPHFGQPKTESSRRVLDLPPDVREVLSDWRAQQRGEREIAGADWEDSGLVFTTALGGYLHPDNLKRVLHRVAKRAGVKPVRIHDLRHTYASLAISNGVPAEVASEKLGHTQVAFTLKQYRHVLEHEHKGYALPLTDLLRERNIPKA